MKVLCWIILLFMAYIGVTELSVWALEVAWPGWVVSGLLGFGFGLGLQRWLSQLAHGGDKKGRKSFLEYSRWECEAVGSAHTADGSNMCSVCGKRLGDPS